MDQSSHQQLRTGKPPSARIGDEVSQAGAGAQAEYQGRRTRRIERLETRFGILGGVIARVSEPDHQRAWAQGARGERILAERLTDLLDDRPIVLLHDRRRPPTKANIDHLAIGPGGVTVIDAKLLTGSAETRRNSSELWVGGRNRTRLVEGVRAQVASVRAALSDHSQGIDVRGVMCFVDPSILPLFSRSLTVGDIRIVGPKGAAEIAGRAGNLTAHHVAEIVACMDRAFPHAT